MLECAYVAGACASGADVLCAGVLPTPGVALLVRELEAAGGAMISASHNPIADNGIKLFGSDGFKLCDRNTARIEELVVQAGDLRRAVGTDVGRILPSADLGHIYLEHLKELVPRSLEGLKVVIDCAHGAACGHARTVFQAVGAQVDCLHDEPDGARINVACGSTDLKALAARVKESHADLGLAFDGDADRCLAVDDQGREVDGDQMMLIFANWLQRRTALPGGSVVATVMSNLGLELALKEMGLTLHRAAVGDRYVLEMMKSIGSVLGGEQSGHIIFLDRSTSGDGILTGLMLAAAVLDSGTSLSRLASHMQRLPQKLVNIPARNKERLDSDATIAEAILRVEERLSSRGRVLVRPSGTEPLVRVMAEGPDPDELEAVLTELSDLIAQRLG